MFKNAIILSGGEGVRMRPLTKYIPKALVEFNGVPLIKNILNLLNTNGVKDIYVTYNYLSEILFNNLKNEVKGFINTTDKDNSYFLFNSFVKHIDEPIIIAPCDLDVNIDFNIIYHDYFTLGEPAIMLVGVPPVSNVDGDFIEFNDDNIITSLDRNKETNVYRSEEHTSELQSRP